MAKSNWNIFAFFLLIFLLSESQSVYAQYAEDNPYFELVNQLENDLAEGKKRALRDLGSLLSNASLKGDIQNILTNYTLFTKSEFDLSQNIKKQAFLDFYYEHENDFKYSELLKAFYLTPVEMQESFYSIKRPSPSETRDPSLRLRIYMEDLNAALEKGNDELVLEAMNKIAALKSGEGFQFIVNLLRKNQIQQSNLKDPKGVCKVFCKVLVNFPRVETVQTILNLVDQEFVNPDFAAPLLANLTNISYTNSTQEKGFSEFYNFWLDSLKTVESIRDFGYQHIFNFQKRFFEFPVDYYGKILAHADAFPWIKYNALKDIKKTHHPRALFYIASMVYKNRTLPNALKVPGQDYVNDLEQITGLKISTEGQNGLSPKQNWESDLEAQRNYLKYWASHYSDYEWDSIRKSFVNKETATALAENYERLFRRLNSRNDSVAVQSYLLLTEGEPIEVLGLSKKYKELLRNYNRSLPSFKHNYLESLVQLTDFCRRNKVRYRAPERILLLLNDLTAADAEVDRYRIENQIIARLSLDEVTAIEYWGCLRASYPKDAFSIGRILDWFYSQHWDKILNSDHELRLYLKKAFLFEQIGVIGICNSYLKKFDKITPDLQKRFEIFLKTEADKDIVLQIRLLQAKVGDNILLSLQNLIASTDDLTLADLKELPPPKPHQYSEIVSAISQNANEQFSEKLIRYLQLHVSLDLVPYLFELLENGLYPTEINQFLEKLFNYQFEEKENGWLALWQSEGNSYRQWEFKFFNEKVENLKTATKGLQIKDINAVTQSSLYQEVLHKKLCLESLPKLKRVRDIRRLSISALSIQKDLIYFQDFEFSHKELDDIPKLFQKSNHELPRLLIWLDSKTADFDNDQKGSFYNSLFRTNWFSNYVNEGLLSDSLTQKILIVLETYLNESDFISEFEEQTTIRNIALIQNKGKNLSGKLLMSFQIDVDEESKGKLQEAILARVSFQELKIVAPFLMDLTILNRYNFLNKDFGLPIFDLQHPSVQMDVIKNLNGLSENDFYQHYLSAFGVSFSDKNGALDYNKIYSILKYDIVTPFVGNGGTKRDYFAYGIIKILELHFKDRLGFHQKLNENQTFYTFSSSKRAQNWMNYLIENDLVQLPIGVTPSFNMTVRE